MVLATAQVAGSCNLSPAPKDGGRLSPFPKDDEVLSPVAAPEVEVGSCNFNPALEDDGRLSPFPRDDEVPSVVPIFKDDDEVVDIGIEKLSVGCLACELLEVAVDLTVGKVKLNASEVVPTCDDNLGTAKLLPVTVEDATGCVLVGLTSAATGKTIDGC